MNIQEQEQFVKENKLIVPKNQVKKFEALSLDAQVAKIEFYKDIIKLRSEAREKNKIVNKVRDLFDKRKASEDDARETIEFCEAFIKTFKDREIEKIDEEIARLQKQKQMLTD